MLCKMIQPKTIELAVEVAPAVIPSQKHPPPAIIAILLLACLYVFVFSLSLLAASFQALGGEAAGDMIASIDNCWTGFGVGLLATVLLQSSSTSTSIVVSMVGAGSLSVRHAIPVIFAANIGTSVTSTIVSLGHIRDRGEYAKAFSGATVHDAFNILTVLLLLPIELISSQAGSGFLETISGALAGGSSSGAKFKSPLKAAVGPAVKLFLKINKTAVKRGGDIIEGGLFTSGVPALIVSIILLTLTLFVLVKLLKSLFLGTATGLSLIHI